MSRLDSRMSVRPLRVSTRCLTGRVALKGGGSATFESSLERDWLEILDFDPSVERIQVQPFSLYYSHEGKRRRYTPDVLVERGGRQGPITTVYEVKPREELREHWARYRPRFRAAVAYCKARGARFKIVTEREIRIPFYENARFLRGYRDLRGQDEIRDSLLSMLRVLGPTTPQALLAATYWAPINQAYAIPMLWHLVAHRIIDCDLHLPLTMSTRIRLADT